MFGPNMSELTQLAHPPVWQEASRSISLRLFLNHRIETDNSVGVLIGEMIYLYCGSLMHSYQGEQSGGKVKASTIRAAQTVDIFNSNDQDQCFVKVCSTES